MYSASSNNGNNLPDEWHGLFKPRCMGEPISASILVVLLLLMPGRGGAGRLNGFCLRGGGLGTVIFVPFVTFVRISTNIKYHNT